MGTDPYRYNDTAGNDDSDEDDNDADTFGPDPTERKRCEKCGHSFITERDYERFLLDYCEVCEKPLCPDCKHPELEPFKTDTASGIYCKKCGKTYFHSQG